MITRIPTFKDYGKLGEQLGTDFVAKWILKTKTNNTVSFVTLDKKQIIAIFLGIYKNNIIDTVLYFYPEGKEEIGKFLLNKVSQQFPELNKIEMTVKQILWDKEDDQEISIS